MCPYYLDPCSLNQLRKCLLGDRALPARVVRFHRSGGAVFATDSDRPSLAGSSTLES